MSDLDPLVWTTAEAGRLLSVSRSTVQTLVAEGRLPAVRIGRRMLIPKVALADFLEREAS